MSMLSTQADKLRKVADLYDGTTQPPMAKELQRPALAQELRDAADTILSLRDRAQKLQAENTKLRELVRQMSYAISPTSREHMLANLAELGIEV